MPEGAAAATVEEEEEEKATANEREPTMRGVREKRHRRHQRAEQRAWRHALRTLLAPPPPHSSSSSASSSASSSSLLGGAGRFLNGGSLPVASLSSCLRGIGQPSIYRTDAAAAAAAGLQEEPHHRLRLKVAANGLHDSCCSGLFSMACDSSGGCGLKVLDTSRAISTFRHLGSGERSQRQQQRRGVAQGRSCGFAQAKTRHRARGEAGETGESRWRWSDELLMRIKHK